jgi:small subunit ribosomal protein S20
LANHKSALKRARQNEIRHARNKAVKTGVKNAVKKVRATATDPSVETTPDDLKEAQSLIAKAAKKGVIHKRTAARKISRLTKLAASAQQ